MAARRSKKETRKAPTQAAVPVTPTPPSSQQEEQEEKIPSTLSQVVGLLLQMALMWGMTAGIMHALKYFGIAQPGGEPEN